MKGNFRNIGMSILDAIGKTSLIPLHRVVPEGWWDESMVTLVVDSGMKYMSTDVYRK